ncbi:putative SOS response-associated peptidase YedK [Diplonema papillatum]|nr:putative SOS response-associated peptidase YedK [Diplonema papillatum]
MCGRGACTLDRAEYNKAIEERLALLRLGGKLNDTTAGKEDGGTTGNAKYNVAPGTVCRVVQLPKDGEAGAYVVRDCGWGIKGSRFLVNARGESIEQKFKGLRRCVFFLSGYYEWDKSLGPSKKQPYYFHKKTADPADLLAVACLCSNHNPGSFVVVTRAATSTLSWIHDRVPLLLHTAEDIRQWLDETTPLSDSAPLRLCVKQEDDKEYGKLAFHPVSKEVGKVAYQGPDCIKKVDLTASPSKAAGGLVQWVVSKEKFGSPQKRSPLASPGKAARSGSPAGGKRKRDADDDAVEVIDDGADPEEGPEEVDQQKKSKKLRA